jgi:hypothetical protein
VTDDPAQEARRPRVGEPVAQAVRKVAAALDVDTDELLRHATRLGRLHPTLSPAGRLWLALAGLIDMDTVARTAPRHREEP